MESMDSLILRSRRRRRLAGRPAAAPHRLAAPIAIVAIVAIAVSAGSARANDSTAELDNGGLDFVRNENVEMRAEDLYISAEQVRVTYRFFNRSDKPVTNLVAFPLPDIALADPDANPSIPTEEPVNFVAFSTRANGIPVTTEVQQQVFAKGIDRTALLKELGVPLAPHLKPTYDALDALPREQWERLIALGIGEPAEYDIGGGMKLHLEPRWTLKTVYYWQQTFPPRQELVIEHRYKPSVGGSAGTGVGSPYASDEETERYRTKYCVDADFIAGAKKAQEEAERAQNRFVSEQRIDYVLKTGANWAGPIKDFSLTVDKGEPENLLSFCAAGIEKVSPTAVRVHYTDFTPQADLAILILKTITADPPK